MKNPSLRIATIVLLFPGAYGQGQPAPSAQEKAISAQISQLRGLPDEVWTQTVGKVAKQIQQLPAGAEKDWAAAVTPKVSSVSESRQEAGTYPS